MKTLKKVLTIILALLSLTTLMACGEEETKDKENGVIIELSSTVIEAYDDADDIQLTAKVYKDNVENKELKPTWSSKDESVVTVTENGLVSIVGIGNTEIVCSVEDVSTTCVVSINRFYETEFKVKLDITELAIAYTKGYSFTDKVKVVKDGKELEGALVEWTSSDDSVASVDNGKITLNGIGNCVISARYEDGGFYSVAQLKLRVGSVEAEENSHDVSAKDIDWGI